MTKLVRYHTLIFYLDWNFSLLTYKHIVKESAPGDLVSPKFFSQVTERLNLNVKLQNEVCSETFPEMKAEKRINLAH